MRRTWAIVLVLAGCMDGSRDTARTAFATTQNALDSAMIRATVANQVTNGFGFSGACEQGGTVTLAGTHDVEGQLAAAFDVQVALEHCTVAN